MFISNLLIDLDEDKRDDIAEMNLVSKLNNLVETYKRQTLELEQYQNKVNWRFLFYFLKSFFGIYIWFFNE